MLGSVENTGISGGTADTAMQRLAADLDMDFVDLSGLEISPPLFSHLGADVAATLQVVPLRLDEDRLYVATANPFDLGLEQRLKALTGHEVELVLASSDAIRLTLSKGETSRKILDSVSDAYLPKIVREDQSGNEQVIDLESLQDQGGMIRLANSIVMAALQRHASDIHIEVFAAHIDVKYRIDGVLCQATKALDHSHHGELISRFKVMAGLDIAEKRKPQDGRFRLLYEDRAVDFRVSILPGVFGEDAVIRILDKRPVSGEGAALTLHSLCLGEEEIAAIRRAAREPHGLFLVTGPTGSGKTTTLYGVLSELAGGEEKIITIEDPVEYQLEGVVQIAVNEKKGVTFASGLRSILRHDPDRIMVGEIRDNETAQIALQAALTGHLVLATVHANNAMEVISRFTQWGLDLNDLVVSLKTVLAQRLLRRNCGDCAEPSLPSRLSFEESGLDPDLEQTNEWRAGRGCKACFQTGFSGRVAAVEQFTMTPEIAALMISRAPPAETAAAAGKAGMKFLRHRGLDLARRGVTTLDEVNRVLRGGRSDD